MHREPDVGFDPGSPGSRPGPKAGAKPLRHPGIPVPTCLFLLLLFFKFLFIYDSHTQREREREAETQTEGEAGSMQGAPCGTRS